MATPDRPQGGLPLPPPPPPMAAAAIAPNAAVAAPANPPLVQAIPIFSLAPALYDAGIIDYSTPRGQKLYKAATDKLQEELFHVDAKGVHSFLTALADKAQTYGWETILNIPRDINQPQDDLIDLCSNYGELTVEQISAHVLIYCNNPCRAAQDSAQLYHCLMASLSRKGRERITPYKKDYTINNTINPSGVLFLKVILRESHIDTRATVRHIRAKLNSLPLYMPSIQFNITAFNRYVLDLLEQLNARGEHTQDLLTNLFEAYKTVNDKDFQMFIKIKEQYYDEGNDIDPHHLMQLAQQKYRTLLGDKKWAIPTQEETKIVALQTELAKLKSNRSPNYN